MRSSSISSSKYATRPTSGKVKASAHPKKGSSVTFELPSETQDPYVIHEEEDASTPEIGAMSIEGKGDFSVSDNQTI